MDVTIRGAGIFGLSIAWACAKRGARVRVIETIRPGAGSSGGPVGALSPHVPEAWNAKKAFQLESLVMAGDWWAEVEAASGLPSGYARLGRLQPAQFQRAYRRDTARALRPPRAQRFGERLERRQAALRVVLRGRGAKHVEALPELLVA